MLVVMDSFGAALTSAHPTCISSNAHAAAVASDTVACACKTAVCSSTQPRKFGQVDEATMLSGNQEMTAKRREVTPAWNVKKESGRKRVATNPKPACTGIQKLQ